MRGSFRYFDNSPETIRLTVKMHIRHPLSPRQVGQRGERGHLRTGPHATATRDYFYFPTETTPSRPETGTL
jgi:hypothetical protein